AKLILQVGEGEKSWVPLEPGGTYVLGRGRDCDITLEHPGVSREHVRLEQGADGRWRVADAGSSNGTFVNGERVEAAVLADGDLLRIGSVALCFRLEADTGGTVSSPNAGDGDAERTEVMLEAPAAPVSKPERKRVPEGRFLMTPPPLPQGEHPGRGIWVLLAGVLLVCLLTIVVQIILRNCREADPAERQFTAPPAIPAAGAPGAAEP
ncbi:MAG: FHA domain-containing protein, partial [Lentisphaeria bacterium]|nr:FHA domain-containing protein [Lentisphaeria bacterium]